MNTAKAVDFPSSPTPVQKEEEVRAWIARKESVCPYAPGLARFVHLPEIKSIKMEHVHYLAHELKAFYDAKVNGKRVGRWMLMPHSEWESHEQAHTYSERMFWLLNAAYFHLVRDKKSVKTALKKTLPGYNRGYKGEILNPVIGKLPNSNANIVPAKSLFYTALSPLYKSKKFYRYSPHAIMPLVYASEFQELADKHKKVSESVAFEMAYGGLFEIFGDELDLDLAAFRQELPTWGAIVDRTAEVLRASSKGIQHYSKAAKGCAASNLSYFRLSKPELVNRYYSKHIDKLNILTNLVRRTGVEPKQIIGACFAGSGLYTIPDYPDLAI